MERMNFMTSVFPALLLSVLLPGGWAISADRSAVPLGSLPVAISVSPDRRYLAITESGADVSGMRVLDARTLQTVGMLSFSQPQSSNMWDPSGIAPLSGGVFGNAQWEQQGRGFWIAASGGDAIAHISLAPLRVDRIVQLGVGSYPVSVALSPDGTRAAVAQLLGGAVSIVRLRDGAVLSTSVVGLRPGGVSWSDDGKWVYAALWGSNQIAVIDAQRSSVVAHIPAGLHPRAIAGQGRWRYAVAADDDRIDVIDTQRNRLASQTHIDLLPGLPEGISASDVFFDSHSRRLYVTCSAANAIAVLQADGPKLTLIGAVSTGWFPTGTALAAQQLFVLDGKGEGSSANPLFNPFSAHPHSEEYIPFHLKGSLRVSAVPATAQLRTGLIRVRRFASANVHPVNARTVVHAGGPITHVIFLVKENRTYDQVLGDLGSGDGDPRLALFGETVTPNAHALARRFGIFDRFFANGQVTANGLNWSTGAFANDYTETLWPASYAGRGMHYDFEDGGVAAHAHAGHLWDAAARAHITYRDYGMWVTNRGPIGTPVTTGEAALAGHIDPKYRGFDIEYADSDREAEWEREFNGFERSGTLPAFEIVRFPGDHTAGTFPGAYTPRAMIADNDLALGRLVAAVSHSRDWPHTLVIAIEDDAQNGPDHVDEQRTVVFLASPYAHAGVYHAHYSTASVLHTIERILGLQPLSPYDALAPTLDEALREPANTAAYDALVPHVNMSARNSIHSYRAAENLRYDWSRADAVPDDFLNDVLMHSVSP